jgi:CheY-specific phosphatase CheX
MNETVLTILAQVAEQMGFLTPTGPGEGPMAEDVVVAVAFTGPAHGRVMVAASRPLIEAMARNLLALDMDAAISESDGREALGELANVVAGNLLPTVLGDGEYQLATPATATWSSDPALVASLDCAEGLLTAGMEHG